MKEAFTLPPIGGLDDKTAASENNMGGTGMIASNKNLEGGSERNGTAERLENGLDGLARRPSDGNRKVA